MPFSPTASPGRLSTKVYLFNCPSEEKENAKKAGAKWDASSGSWYVLSTQSLEAFNQWLPNERKYLICSYEEKDDAKKLGAKWDPSCKQWYIEPHQTESSFSKWLPSSAKKSKKTSKTTKTATTTTKPSKESDLAKIPRINEDMTVAQLQAECKYRDPSIKGISNKSKTWLLEHLKVGSCWISGQSDQESSRKSEPTKMTVSRTAPVPKPRKAQITTKKTTKKKLVISADITIAQMQLECRARDPSIKGITNKNKSWFLDHLGVGSPWISQGWAEDDLAKNTSGVLSQLSTNKKATESKSSKVNVAPPVKPPSINRKELQKKRPIKKDPDGPTILSKQPPENSKKKQKVKEEKPAIEKTQETTTKGKKEIAAKQSTTTEPKTDATSAATSYTRITKKMSVAKLKEEATARHIDCKRIPRTKIDILDLLVEGSICIHESTEYINYQNLLRKVEKERHAFELHQAELRRQRYEKEEQKRVHAERKRQEERDLEIARQKALHVHSFPRVHPCPLAKSKELTLHGKSRPEKCNVCGYFLWNNSIYYSCESCDWDTCQRCFEQNNMAQEEKEEDIRKRRRLILEAEAEREREMERHRKRQQKLDEEHRKRQEEHERNAKQRFESKVIKVEGKHIDPNSGLQFLVWYSDGYDNDGWHSYEGEPTKEFDSVWGTKTEANNRAEYLFFWKNPWGIEPDEVGDDDGEVFPKTIDGLKKFTVAPADSTRWTVGVVPTSSFIHLSNSSAVRDHLEINRVKSGWDVLFK